MLVGVDEDEIECAAALRGNLRQRLKREANPQIHHGIQARARNIFPRATSACLRVGFERDQAAIGGQRPREPDGAVAAERSDFQNSARALEARQQLQSLPWFGATWIAGRPAAALAPSAASNAGSGGTSRSVIYWSTAVQSARSWMILKFCGGDSQASERSAMSLTSGRKSAAAAATWRSAALARSAPFGLHRPPALERRKQPRRDLRVFRVEIEDDVRDEIIAAAILRVELGLIAGGERRR